MFYIFTLFYLYIYIQYYVEHNGNKTYRQASGRGNRGQGRAEEVEGGEEGTDGVEARRPSSVNRVVVRTCPDSFLQLYISFMEMMFSWCYKIFHHQDRMYISIPMTESLGPRLAWAQICSQNLRSICGYWTRPIWGLKVNDRFHDKLRSEMRTSVNWELQGEKVWKSGGNSGEHSRSHRQCPGRLWIFWSQLVHITG